LHVRQVSPAGPVPGIMK
jgi:hypothetical protein